MAKTRAEKLREYAEHCARMQKIYAPTHRLWLFYGTMAHAKAIQARYWASR